MLVIPIFIPHWGCPHQCSFCNQKTISGTQPSIDSFESSFHRTIQTYLSYQGKRSRVELAFFGGNFLGLGENQIVRLLELAQPYIDQGLVHGLRFSTRPDTVNEKTLALVRERSICLIELGIQSMNDDVLLQCQRGHTRKDSLAALELLAGQGIPAGVQILPGLPGETRQTFLRGVEELARQHPATARIYPLVVLDKSPLAHQYRKGEYRPLELSQAVEWTKTAWHIFAGKGVKVIRMGLQASDMLVDGKSVLAGPYHPAFGHLVFSSMFLDKAVDALNVFFSDHTSIYESGELFLVVHPRSESRLRGEKNSNIAHLQTMFPGFVFSVVPDEGMKRDEVRVKVTPQAVF